MWRVCCICQRQHKVVPRESFYSFFRFKNIYAAVFVYNLCEMKFLAALITWSSFRLKKRHASRTRAAWAAAWNQSTQIYARVSFFATALPLSAKILSRAPLADLTESHFNYGACDSACWIIFFSKLLTARATDQMPSGMRHDATMAKRAQQLGEKRSTWLRWLIK